MRRAHLLPLLLALPLCAGFLGPCKLVVTQEVLHFPGYVEPHTPGSGQPEEMAVGPDVVTIGGPDLNRVSIVRTYLDGADDPPAAILILIPGFLGGASTFDPLARDLVGGMLGLLEVWAVDRRPNQLEDRLGALHAFEGATEPACQTSPPQPDCAIFEGAQFYFPDADNAPVGNFPGPEDADLDLDGVLDPRLELPVGDPAARGAILFEQDDLRFMAHWGLDTYFRDWKLLVERARAIVGPDGVVLIGGHSMGTTWSSLFVAYDFDPDPAVTVAGHSLVDGLVLIEGGGSGPPSATAPTLADYEAAVADLASPGGEDVFLENFSVIDLKQLAQVGEVGSLAAFYQGGEPSLAQRTPAFGPGSLISLLLGAPATNRAMVGFFLDDDYSVNTAFRASMGFSDDGANGLQAPSPPLISAEWYAAGPPFAGGLRHWKEHDDPTLPSVLDSPPCNPAGSGLGNPTATGCAIVDNGAPSAPGNPPKTNGLEREVTPMDAFLQTQFGLANGFEWYFASGRPFLDLSFGRDSSALVAEHLALHPGDEGPLVVTQNATMALPVIAIGGSNGLAPQASSFEDYLGSIATPPAQKQVHILEGYAHVDPLTAEHNEAVPLILGFVNERLGLPLP